MLVIISLILLVVFKICHNWILTLNSSSRQRENLKFNYHRVLDNS